MIDKNNFGNGHFYWILLPKSKRKIYGKVKANGLELTTHYEPFTTA